MIEGDLIRDGGGNDAGATGIKNLGKANVEFPMTIKLLINQAHFLQKEIRDSERRGGGEEEEEEEEEDSIEKILILDSAVTQLAVQVEILFYNIVEIGISLSLSLSIFVYTT